MLKVIRQVTETHPRVYQVIFLVIAVTFVISMGWWGFSTPGTGTGAVARVGQETIPFSDYQQAYEARIRAYRERFKDALTDDMLKRLGIDPKREAIHDLIERKLWRRAADEAGLRVEDAELQFAIAQVPAFQRGGQFDPALYRQILAQIRMTPAAYEQAQREAYQAEKMRMLVRDAVALTAAEMEDAKRVTSSDDPAELQQAIADRLVLKRERAVLAFSKALWARTPVTISEELL